jgi:two-component system response regulator HydG
MLETKLSEMSFMVLNSFNEIISVLNSHTEPAVLISTDYQVLAANEAYRLHYTESGEIVGRKCYEVSHGYNVPCDLAGELCPLQQCKQSGHKQRVLHLHESCQGREHVDVNMTPIQSDSGEIVGFLEIMKVVKSFGDDKSQMVGESKSFLKLLEMIQRAAPSEISVLLQGESGTGKELAASAIHNASTRSSKPFVTVECAGLTDSLFESELFGHEKGAFTGAINKKKGLVEMAHGGTLFLDEVGDIPLPLQVKLLRLIESGTYRTVGGVDVKQADFRLICATHKSLKLMVEEGTFRRDLYYRIAGFPIDLPKLTDRKEDIPKLAVALLKRIPDAAGKRLSKASLSLLREYNFPGNIRELRNILERAVLLCDDDLIEPIHLPDECYIKELKVAPSASATSWLDDSDLMTLEQLEARYISQLTKRFSGDNKTLARVLGISERTLYRKLQSLREIYID